jgi:hypothetical protein
MSSEKQGCPEVNEFAMFLVLSEGKLPLHLELPRIQSCENSRQNIFLSVKAWKINIWSVGAILTF